MTNKSDDQLIQDFRDGVGHADERALFDEIFARYHSRVAAWCYRFTRDRELALDLAQEVFIKAFRRFHTFRSDSKLSTWLYSIARNHCIDAMHRRSNDLLEAMDLGKLAMPDHKAVDAEAAYGRFQEQQARMNLVTGSLNPLETKVMVLHYGHDVPIQKVTTMLDLKNASGAKAFIVSARRKLSAAVRQVQYA